MQKDLESMRAKFTDDQYQLVFETKSKTDPARWLVMEYSCHLPLEIREIDVQLLIEQAITAQSADPSAKPKDKL